MIFKWEQGLIWVSFEIQYEGKNNKIENCILDTGSATTAIDIDLVQFNFQKPTKIKRLYGIGGGTQEVVSQKIDAIKLDELKLKSIDIEFGDFKEDLGINGFVGNDLLSHFEIRIDYSQKIVSLSPTSDHGSD